MKINKKIILFTYDFPLGNSEKTFLEYEINNLIKNFKEVEIIPQINNHSNIKIENKFKVNLGLSKNLSITNIILFGIFLHFFQNNFILNCIKFYLIKIF